MHCAPAGRSSPGALPATTGAATRPSSIVLLHDVLYNYEDARYASREAALGAVTRVLAAASGVYRFVTVPELLRLGRPQREFWIKLSQAEYLAALKHGEI
jgi:hypothetical protein